MKTQYRQLSRCSRHLAGAMTIAARMAMVLGVLGATVLRSSASTEVRGQLDDMQVQSENATVTEILEALSAKFKITYKLRSGVGPALSGLYSGSLRQVLTRVLDGNDYIINASGEVVEVTVLGASRVPGAASPNQTAAAVRESPIVVSTAPAPNAPPPLSSFLSR